MTTEASPQQRRMIDCLPRPARRGQRDARPAAAARRATRWRSCWSASAESFLWTDLITGEEPDLTKAPEVARSRPDVSDRPLRVPDLPAVRGDLRPRDRGQGRRRQSAASAATATTCSATASSAPRARRSSSCTRTPTACARRWCGATTASCTRRRGTRRSPRSSAGCCRSSRRTAATRSPSTSATRTSHNLSGSLYLALRSSAPSAPRNVYSASTVDQRPKEISSGLMFGTMHQLPGARHRPHRLPAHARRQPVRVQRQPGHRARLARPARGDRRARRPGRRRRPEAHQDGRDASEHVPIRPGTDAHLLVAMVNVLFAEDLVDLGAAGRVRRRPRRGAARVRADFTPEAVAPVTGIDADDHPPPGPRAGRRADRASSTAASARAPRSSARWPAGWSTCSTSLTGNLDRPGGAMFAKPAAGGANTRGTPRQGPGREARPAHQPGARACPRRSASSRSRASPRRSTRRARARSGRWSPSPATRRCRRPTATGWTRALATLEFMVSVDIYVNETTPPRRRDLPGAEPARPRATTTSPSTSSPSATWPTTRRRSCRPRTGRWTSGRSLAKLALIAQGMGADADPAIVDDLAIRGAGRARRASTPTRRSPSWRRASGPSGILDFMLRTGPYELTPRRAARATRTASTSAPLEPRLPEVLRTPSGMIELAPEPILADVPRLRAVARPPRRHGGFVLIGRRHLRSNNSWMHNVNVLVKGKPRCTLQSTPTTPRGSACDGGTAKVVVTRRRGGRAGRGHRRRRCPAW